MLQRARSPLRVTRAPARIAIAPRRFPGDAAAAGAWRRRQLFFERELMRRVASADGLPIGLHLPARDEASELAEHYASLCDGLLLQGGTDIDAALSQTTSAAEPDTDRDAFELALVEEFLRRDKAVLGVCRGMQLINVAAGGTLKSVDGANVERHSDPARYADHAHTVSLAHDGYLARLYGCVAGNVSSAHRQAVGELGAGLRVEAHDVADGGIEAIRSTRHRYAVGVQWHPELDDARAGRLDGFRLIADFVAQALNPGQEPKERMDTNACSTLPVR